MENCNYYYWQHSQLVLTPNSRPSNVTQKFERCDLQTAHKDTMFESWKVEMQLCIVNIYRIDHI